MYKKHLTLFAISLILVLLLNNCSKDKEFVIQGKVFDATTNIPIPDVKISFTQICRDCPYIADKTVMSGIDGSFQFVLDNNYKYSGFISASHPLFESKSQHININGEKINIQDIHIQPLAYIKVHIKDTGLVTDNYVICFSDKHIFSGCGGYAKFDSVFCCGKVSADVNDTFEYEVNDYTHSKQETIKIPYNIPKSQTKVFELYY